jgi:hypothetical protein
MGIIQSFKEFFTSFGKWLWIVVIDYIFGFAGVYQTITGTTTLNRIDWAIAFILAFTIPSFIAFHKMRKSREEYKSKLNINPSIIVKPDQEQDIYYLEVKNNGGVGKFKAQIIILEDNNNRLNGLTRVGFWSLSKHHHESEIMRNQIDKLQIFRLTNDVNGNSNIEIREYIYPDDNMWKSVLRWATASRTGTPTYSDAVARYSVMVLPQIYKLRVYISSNPDLKEGSFVQDYEWHSDSGLKEIGGTKTNLKSTSHKEGSQN